MQQLGELVYQIGGGQELAVVPSVLDVFERYRQDRFWKCEAGGQLFATFSDGLATIRLATTPSRKDHRSRFRFIPSLRRQQAEIDEQFKHGLSFIGDWHTHPQGIPEMSALDRQSMEECFEKSTHQLNAFVMIIVGTSSFPSGLSVSLHDHDGCYKAKLSRDMNRSS